MNIERGRTKHKLCHMVMGIAATLFYIVPSFAKDGAAVYETVCRVCHGTGVMGAPKYGDKPGWKNRISKGVATLEKNAIIEGFEGEKGLMPAKGGRSSLSDEEVKAAVAYMIDAVK
ncbi:MAG TPA: cytochrome c5 family protein [Gammaproteobacteria bacterium]|nr:cytochrome c5 family protein [Gammaproteobacteria bacterium]